VVFGSQSVEALGVNGWTRSQGPGSVSEVRRVVGAPEQSGDRSGVKSTRTYWVARQCHPAGGDKTSMGGSGASAQIAAIRAQAAQLLGTLTARATGRSDPGGHLLLNAGIRELVPWGWQGTSRKVVAAWGRSARIAARDEANRRVDALVGEARALAGSHSIADESLRASPNSAKLLRRFGPTLDRGAPETRIRVLIRALDQISYMPLIPNQEVPRLHERHQFGRARDRTARSAPELADLLQRLQGPQDAEYYAARLSSVRMVPKVAESIDGAITRLKEGGSDAYRQGAASLRIAFELLVTELTGDKDWRSGVGRLMQSDEERGIARRLHRLLSRSVHPGHVPSKEDLQLALDLFATVATRLVQLRSSGEGPNSRTP
jgi:hypothetical protein